MRIKIKIRGVQFIQEVTGEVVSWGQAVEHFGGMPMQVPSVTVIENGRVLTISLQAELRHVEATVEVDGE